MAIRPLERVLYHLRRAAQPPGDGLTDGELLGRFLAGRDEAAFAALVRRHGPMVLAVCRRVLDNLHDAEDAFQATFLVLVRRAASVVPRDLVGNWLHGVAYRTALEAKATRARRRTKEAQVTATPDAKDPSDQAAEREQLRLLDRELTRLPERYRAAVVLCDLEGKTQREAARLSGCPEKTLSTRLRRARKLLARRLAGAGAPAVVFSAGAARAAVSAPLCQATIHAALAVAAGRAAVPATSARVAALAEGVLKAMLLNRLKLLSLGVALLGLLALGVGFLARPVLAEKPAERPTADKRTPARNHVREAIIPKLEAMRWNLLAIDFKKRTLHVGDASVQGPGAFSRRDGGAESIFISAMNRLGVRGLPVAQDARITINGKGAAFKDLHPGLLLSLKFAAAKPVITVIKATTPPPGGFVLKGVDVAKRTITVALSRDGKPVVLPVARPVNLEHLKAGQHVGLFVEVEDGQFVVKDIKARK